MSTYFNAPVSGTGNGTIAISTKTLNNGSSVRGAVLSISNGEKTANSTLSQRFKPIFRRNGSGDISGSGGTMSVSVNSSYPFWFRNNPDNVSAITYGNTDYKNVNPISSGSYTFNVSIMGNSSSARTDTLEMAFQKINGSYSFNNPDATDFQIVYSQESGSTPTPPEPPTPSGTSINVPIYFDSDGVNIWIGLGQALPFVLRPSVVIEHSQGNRELINYVIPISETAVTFDDGNNQPFYVSDFDTSLLNYVSIVEVYAGSGAPAYTVTYGDTEYYIYWSEDYSSNLKTYLENVGNNCLDEVTWGTEPDVPIDYSKEYFTIEALSSGTLSWGLSRLSYSLNNGSWNIWAYQSSVNLSAGDKVRFKSAANITNNYKTISFTGDFNVYGNSMSLFYGDNFANQTTLPSTSTTTTYEFEYLFKNNTTLIDAENLILPATTLHSNTYRDMFKGCTALTKAPEIPATTLAQSSCNGMFSGCTSLVKAPSILPATTLTQYCYSNMFDGCSSLTTAPILPATTIQGNSYTYMFKDCTSLENVQSALPATTLALNCYLEMFRGCTSLRTAPELPATTLATYCYDGMFKDCTSLENVQSALPATTLQEHCYEQMFAGCSNLETAPELPAQNFVNYCYADMFSGCTNLNYIKCLAKSKVGISNPTANWVYGVASTGTFVKNASASSSFWDGGTNGIPYNWTVTTT